MPAEPALAHHHDPHYNAFMELGIKSGSKLHFMDAVPMKDIAHVVDFGCGDGSMLKVLGAACPGAVLEGVDNSAKQRLYAGLKVPTARIVDNILRCTPPMRQPSLLVLSSVLHELANPEAWWREAETLGFDYIAVRDFGVSKALLLQETPGEWLDAAEEDPTLLEQLYEVDAKFGPVAIKYHFAHFLLKYPWLKDWEQEMQEDYLRMPSEDLIAMCTGGGYEAVTTRHTSTPFFQKQCRQDLGIYPEFTTHVEMVLRAR